MKKLTFIFMGVFTISTLAGCSQGLSPSASADLNALTADGGESATITEISATGSASDSLDNYTITSFSSHIYTQNSTQAFLIDFNFFPAETDFDSVNKTASVPCTYDDVSDSVSASVSAAVDSTPCNTSVSVDLSAATFSFLGITFSGGTSIDAFADTFGFKITSTGFVDALDGVALTVASDATLETVYDALIAKRVR